MTEEGFNISKVNVNKNGEISIKLHKLGFVKCNISNCDKFILKILIPKNRKSRIQRRSIIVIPYHKDIFGNLSKVSTDQFLDNSIKIQHLYIGYTFKQGLYVVKKESEYTFLMFEEVIQDDTCTKVQFSNNCGLSVEIPIANIDSKCLENLQSYAKSEIPIKMFEKHRGKYVQINATDLLYGLISPSQCYLNFTVFQEYFIERVFSNIILYPNILDGITYMSPSDNLNIRIYIDCANISNISYGIELSAYTINACGNLVQIDATDIYEDSERFYISWTEELSYHIRMNY